MRLESYGGSQRAETNNGDRTFEMDGRRLGIHRRRVAGFALTPSARSIGRTKHTAGDEPAIPYLAEPQAPRGSGSRGPASFGMITARIQLRNSR